MSLEFLKYPETKALEQIKINLSEGGKVEGHSELGQCQEYSGEVEISIVCNLLWLKSGRELPDNVILQSLCYNDSCCNPNHLEAIMLEELERRNKKPNESSVSEVRHLQSQLEVGFRQFFEAEGEALLDDDGTDKEGWASPSHRNTTKIVSDIESLMDLQEFFEGDFDE